MAVITDKYRAMLELIIGKKVEVSKVENITIGSKTATVVGCSFTLLQDTVKFDDKMKLNTNKMDYYCTNKFVISTDLNLIIVNIKYVKSEHMYQELFEFFELYHADIKDAIGKTYLITETFKPEDHDYKKAKYIMDSYKRALIVDMKKYEQACKAFDTLQRVLDQANVDKNEAEIAIRQKKSIFAKPLAEIIETIKKDMGVLANIPDIESCDFTDSGCVFKMWPIVLSEKNKYACIGGIEFTLHLAKGHIQGVFYDRNDILNKKPYEIVDHKNHMHPHLPGDGQFCMGSKGGNDFKDLCNKGELLPVVKFVSERVKHYSIGNPYFRMNEHFVYYNTIAEAIKNERRKR